MLERTEKAGCRLRKDSVMMIETLITASPELFREMSREEMMDFMKRAYTFVAERVGEDNIVSAVIHLDEKTPHMHLCFVPLTKDHRLCAKEILGNRTHLSKYWQDGFFEYMHEQYPQLAESLPQKPNESTFRFGFTRRENILIGCMGKSKRYWTISGY